GPPSTPTARGLGLPPRWREVSRSAELRRELGVDDLLGLGLELLHHLTDVLAGEHLVQTAADPVAAVRDEHPGVVLRAGELQLVDRGAGLRGLRQVVPDLLGLAGVLADRRVPGRLRE